MASIIVAEIDLDSGTLLLASEGFVAATGMTRQAYDGRLRLPIVIGARIAAEQYGVPLRGAPNGGTIDIAIGRNIPAGVAGGYQRDPWTWFTASQHWQGKPYRLYTADPGDARSDFEAIYTGRVDDLTHDGSLKASVKTTSAGLDLDAPLVDELYDDTFPQSIRGRPKPELRGRAFNIAPVLIDEATNTWQISRLAVPVVDQLRVGGVPWGRNDGSPGPGEYSVNTGAGTVTLGGITLGADVRVDARGANWDFATTAQLLKDFTTEAGASYDGPAMAALDTAAPYLVGWWTGTDPINRQDAFDQLTAGIGGWWYVDGAEHVVAGLLDAPAVTADVALTEINIKSLALAGLVPPAWRIRVEHSRNWAPQTSFFENVSEDDKQRFMAAGEVSEIEDTTIKDLEPRAVDVPLIRSFVNSPFDAAAIHNRLLDAWGTARKLYNVTLAAGEPVPVLYQTASVAWAMVSGNFRVHSWQRSLGGGNSQLVLYG